LRRNINELWTTFGTAQFTGGLHVSVITSEVTAMRHGQVTTSRTTEGGERRFRELGYEPAADLIEAAQLRRLASTVLSKSPEDLAALAETNPLLVWEWISAFRNERLAAEAEARYWSAAVAALATATPEAARTAAE
jgi:hypothetical protein